MNSGSRFIPRGTILICPKCRSNQAIVSVDIYPDQAFDWRVIVPIEKDAMIGVSSCCLERYVTFDGLFHCDYGAV